MSRVLSPLEVQAIVTALRFRSRTLHELADVHLGRSHMQAAAEYRQRANGLTKLAEDLYRVVDGSAAEFRAI